MGSLRSSAPEHQLGHLVTESLAEFGINHLVDGLHGRVPPQLAELQQVDVGAPVEPGRPVPLEIAPLDPAVEGRAADALLLGRLLDRDVRRHARRILDTGMTLERRVRELRSTIETLMRL